ncbi:MAG: type 4a pilus biogenesis protein PilO [Clostridiales bacterium]|jgi:type IV pilus assembly protein PilO|nr:type 4a pilus biogenesis protein PilO [Clostridiales bacterium]
MAGKKKQNSTLLILFFVVIFVVGLMLILMQFNSLNEGKARLAEEEQLLALAQTRLQSMIQLKEQSDEMEEKLELLTQLLPGSPAEDDLIVDLQSGADLSDMGLFQIRFGERVSKEGYQEMPLNLVFEGSYHEILHLLDYLNAYERAIRVDELRLDPPRAESAKMSVNLRASAFYAAK